MNIGAQTKIDEKGVGDFVLKLSTTGIYSQALQQGQTSSNTPTTEDSLFSKDLAKNTTAKEYADGDKQIREWTMHFNNLQEFNDHFKTAKAGEFKVNIAENKSFFKNTYVYTMNLPDKFTAEELSKDVNKNENSNQNAIVSEKDVVDFLSTSISVSNSLTVPGKVIKTNATKTEGNILSWGYTLSQIKKGDTMTATYEITNTQNIALACVGGGVIIITLIAFAVSANKKKKKEQEESQY